MLFNITNLVDDRNCYEVIRELRWSDGVKCPHCGGTHYKRHGYHNTCEHRHRYQCKGCQKYFDDLTNTVFEGHHQPLKVWILCLYLMGLNLSNAQIAQELGLNESVCQNMTTVLRTGFYNKRPEEVLEGEVELDELYVVAGHKGNSDKVKKKSVSLDGDG